MGEMLYLESLLRVQGTTENHVDPNRAGIDAGEKEIMS
jgi:hypothetical protein